MLRSPQFHRERERKIAEPTPFASPIWLGVVRQVRQLAEGHTDDHIPIGDEPVRVTARRAQKSGIVQGQVSGSVPVRAKGLRESALPGLARAPEIDHGGIG